jgi:hypothetical protein
MVVTARPVPARHWRSYGDDPLPSGAGALDEPFRAFPSWFMRKAELITGIEGAGSRSVRKIVVIDER